MIKLEEISPGNWKVYWDNGVYIGDFLTKEDGYCDWWPEHRFGYLPSYMLREIADKLDEINAPWEKSINDFFDKKMEVDVSSG